MAMDVRTYFRLACSQMLQMERDILQMNEAMARNSHHPRLKEAFGQHAQPTYRQIANLEQIVDRLGGIMGPLQSPVTQGMMVAYQLFIDMNPSPPIVDIRNALEGDKVEHLEMAGYHGLMTLANQLGMADIAHLLEENLHDEEHMRTRLEGLLPDLLGEAGPRREAA